MALFKGDAGKESRCLIEIVVVYKLERGDALIVCELGWTKMSNMRWQLCLKEGIRIKGVMPWSL